MARSDKNHTSRDKARLVRTKEARKRYLSHLREAYAEELFSKFLNELSGTLTMKNHKGTWYLVFSCGQEEGMVQGKGKTLAHALIDLATKIPLTPEGGKAPSPSERAGGEDSGNRDITFSEEATADLMLGVSCGDIISPKRMSM